MKQDFYSIFYDKTKNVFISELFSRILYVIYIIKFLLKNFLTKDKIVDCDNSLEIISEVFPKTEFKTEIVSNDVDNSIDVSVIVPIYNYSKLIPSLINSILNQKTKYNFELILVDDGSTDGASEICDDFANKDNRVVVIHQKNAGIGAARDTGLNNARGKYIMFADCDDFVKDEFIETMLDEAYKTDNDIVICGYTLVKKQDNKEISRREIQCSPNNLKGYKDSEDLIMNYQGLPWNKIYKREIFSDIRYIPGYWYEDTISHFLVFRKCKTFSYVNKSLYDYMWYENNFSHTQNKVSPKSLQRYWMLEVMSEETERIGLKKDSGYYKVLLRHLGKVLYSGVSSFDEKIKVAAFTAGCDLLIQAKPKDIYNLTYFEKKLEKVLLNKNIGKWELISQFI